MKRLFVAAALNFSLLAFSRAQGLTNVPVPAPTVGVSQTAIVPPSSQPAAPPNALVWDAEAKEYQAKPGDQEAKFTFSLTNVSSVEVVINDVTTSCGCTVAQLPSKPWHIAPGTNGEIHATMNLAGKQGQGRVSKQLNVTSSIGFKALMVTVIMPAPTPVPTDNGRGDRLANMESAKADRQAVFKGDCRSCHVEKGVGKLAKDLYAADCGICHESPHRASMVPDLRAPKTPRDREYWNNWVAHGRIGSMMPAFLDKEGGPLSKEQIDSLVTYLWDEFPRGLAVLPSPVNLPVAPKSSPVK
ncbi:MAG: DUF1573 domain-containing protein [Verrucomicrobiota bacterium]